MHLAYDDAVELVQSFFTAAHFSPDESRICTREILDAEWRGKRSYGLELVPHVAAWRAQKAGDPEISHEGPASAFVEGNDGLGPVVAAFAMDLALERARSAGVALVGVRNKWPWLTGGYHVRRAAEEGFVAATWSAGVSIVAPHGGVRPVFGTNPFAIAVPSNGGPVVLDAAVTSAPASAIRDAKRRGEPLPEGAAVDRAGRPTRDPAAARKGAMLPFGGHRGSGLAMMIELLGGAWVGGKTGTSRRGSRGFVYLVAGADLFGFGSELPEAAESLVRDMAAAAGSPADVHVPGRTPVDFAAPCEVDDEVVDKLTQLAGSSRPS